MKLQVRFTLSYTTQFRILRQKGTEMAGTGEVIVLWRYDDAERGERRRVRWTFREGRVQLRRM